ncbi:retron system putative HNH endonuclease [Phormidesmis sp. 146-35]
MRHIQKQQEPEVLTKWRQDRKNRNKTWKNFNPPVKQAVRQSLLQEQGYICCYCEMRIGTLTCRIDHLVPRSVDRSLWFDYYNLLASCPGEDEVEKKPVFCEQQRGNRLLPVSPLQEECIQAFGFRENGEVFAKDQSGNKEAVEQTIEILGLNVTALKRQRSAAIQGFLGEDFDTLSLEVQQKLLYQLDRLNSNNQYEPFCSAITFVLKQNMIL